MGSTSTSRDLSSPAVASTEATANARCLNPQASGLLGRLGGFGKLNNSIWMEP
jgi:hypothetical protein